MSIQCWLFRLHKLYFFRENIKVIIDNWGWKKSYYMRITINVFILICQHDICFFYFVLTVLIWFFSKRWINHFRIQKHWKPSNLIIHQHKGVCYRQVVTHPMTACLGVANVLRKQELRLWWAVIAHIICFYTYKRLKNRAAHFNNWPRY